MSLEVDPGYEINPCTFQTHFQHRLIVHWPSFSPYLLIKPCATHQKRINKTPRNNTWFHKILVQHSCLDSLVKLQLETTEKHKQRISRNSLTEALETSGGSAQLLQGRHVFWSKKGSQGERLTASLLEWKTSSTLALGWKPRQAVEELKDHRVRVAQCR